MPPHHKVSPRNPRAREPILEAEAYERHKSKIAVVMGRFTLRHLNGIYREFGGDMVQAIVLGEIAHHNITSHYSGDMPLPGTDGGTFSGPGPWKELRTCNAFSISEATGIPRETVRRKIASLIQKGWVEAKADSSVVITRQVSAHFLGGFNAQTCRELLETAERISFLLRNEGKE